MNESFETMNSGRASRIEMIKIDDIRSFDLRTIEMKVIHSVFLFLNICSETAGTMKRSKQISNSICMARNFELS